MREKTWILSPRLSDTVVIIIIIGEVVFVVVLVIIVLQFAIVGQDGRELFLLLLQHPSTSHFLFFVLIVLYDIS